MADSKVLERVITQANTRTQSSFHHHAEDRVTTDRVSPSVPYLAMGGFGRRLEKKSGEKSGCQTQERKREEGLQIREMAKSGDKSGCQTATYSLFSIRRWCRIWPSPGFVLPEDVNSILVEIIPGLQRLKGEKQRTDCKEGEEQGVRKGKNRGLVVVNLQFRGLIFLRHGRFGREREEREAIDELEIS
ncbi:hypothetical protein Acr_24g0005670 [Actinidia rufa]|uniref:Uncharacterized protein n=1 Tax=Actinidia rufa TaxID=165716 RepID=A0A7J0GU58_9ERIC|nr:hypothetical protein Acr_24g0005670 [Actinidia rufa]